MQEMILLAKSSILTVLMRNDWSFNFSCSVDSQEFSRGDGRRALLESVIAVDIHTWEMLLFNEVICTV
jgi:hypothetical protein